MPKSFIMNSHTEIKPDIPVTKPIRNVIAIFKRDMRKVLSPDKEKRKSLIILKEDSELKKETFSLRFEDNPAGEIGRMILSGGDELGLIYGLLYLSKTYLSIPPFWFWNDVRIKASKEVKIPAKTYFSKSFYVRYRGWFINDEMLLLGWKDEKYSEKVWRPVFEALLRCGGNMVIPGTGETSRHLWRLASDMGLILTHHHAEPLGAELFLSAYPDKKASYKKNAPLFEKLWKQAILRQKDKRVVWGLGFRGQGDAPFWCSDPSYDTPQARGKLISDVIRRQYEMLCRYVDSPVCCTSLYGEIMELYRRGFLKFPDGVIKVWADNGYGKMVCRRQGNENLRIPSLPKKEDKPPNGLYYHVSFHDLQASNHLTMLPNGPKLITSELKNAFRAGANSYLIVNCGSLKPHIYLLDLVSRLWSTGTVNIDNHLRNYVKVYFDNAGKEVEQCFRNYFKAAVPYGPHGDDRAGEQFYHYPVRNIISHWLQGNQSNPETRLVWATGGIPFADQVKWFAVRYAEGEKSWKHFYKECFQTREKLVGNVRQSFNDTLLLQAELHRSGCRGGLLLCRSYFAYCQKDFLHAYLYANASMRAYQEGLKAMKAAEHGIWIGFYRNDCLTNVRLTVSFLDVLRRWLRILGDGGECINWERKYLVPKSLRRTMLETTYTNQLTDDELYNEFLKHGLLNLEEK